MNKKLIFDVPKILISEQKIFSIADDNSTNSMLQLKSNKGKRVSDILDLYPFDEITKNIDKQTLIASLSYKKVGHRLAKHISLAGSLDFFFIYNKNNGYFDREGELISPSGNEYSISNISLKKFYSELIDVLKLRLVLGYIGSDNKKESVEFYFREAHKFILKEKYKLNTDECMNFLRGVVSKSFIPENFTEGFLSELSKTIYETELSDEKAKEIKDMAEISLKNKKKGKVPFYNIELHKKVLDEIKKEENVRQLNLIKLREAMSNNIY